DRSDRFICSEFIREQILNRYKKEVPYSVEVDVDSFKDEPKILRIRAILVVARESQKGILIGHKGVALKAVGTAARRQLELFYGKQVYLELFVKVNSNWRNDPEKLKRYGY
ncbi:MAG: KH domain-containing protein, partial [Schleiferiaceae bacterium]|nr:KH domain-containing protein [Schleiferiaceae bacterium]